MKSKTKKRVRAVSQKAQGKIAQMAHSYDKKDTKGNWHKSASEVVTTVAGGGLSATLGGIGNGYVSIGLGLVSIIVGNLMKDPTKLTSVLGASMVGYGIGKFEEHKSLSNDSSLKGLDGAKSKLGQGFSRFATEMANIIGMKKKSSLDTSTEESDKSVGSVDVSVLDQFESLNQMEAIKFEEQQSQFQEIEDDINSEFLLEEDTNESHLIEDLKGIDDYDEDLMENNFEQEEFELEQDELEFEPTDLSII